MDPVDDDLVSARAAYADGRWSDARRLFRAAGDDLDTGDMVALADASWWLGIIDEALHISEQVHDRRLRAGDARAAAMDAIEIGFHHMLRGQPVVGSGWLARARRLLAEHAESVEYGYLLMIDASGAMAGGELEVARTLAADMLAIAERHADVTLRTLAVFTDGSAIAHGGDVARGMAVIDDAMLTVVAGGLEPGWAGNLYCQMMALCHAFGDVERARQWTAATLAWCDGFEAAVMFGGICRLHRVQLLQLDGEWGAADAEVRRACTELADLNVEIVAEAHYLLGELSLCRDDPAGAADAFDRAAALGRSPYPGRALALLHDGRVGDAVAALAVALVETADDPLVRAPLLAAAVEAGIAAGDDRTAGWVDELEEIAGRFGSPRWSASARLWRGALHNAAGDHTAALPVLRDALRDWQHLGVPCEAARTRVQIAVAADALGDHDRAATERRLAAEACDSLGRTDWLTRTVGLANDGRYGPLTEREVQVLAGVARGLTNREIATELFISHRTVDRHLTNVYAKLGCSTRAAAVAWAADHDLL